MEETLSTTQTPDNPDLATIPPEQQAPFLAFLGNGANSLLDLRAKARHFRDTYLGEYASREDYARAYLEETGELNTFPGHLRDYFDYFLYARDLFASRFLDLKSPRGIYVFYGHAPEGAHDGGL
jgi:hypothetical protein